MSKEQQVSLIQNVQFLPKLILGFYNMMLQKFIFNGLYILVFKVKSYGRFEINYAKIPAAL